MQRRSLVIALLPAVQAGCDRQVPTSDSLPAQPPPAVTEPLSSAFGPVEGQKMLAALAADGAHAFSVLSPRADIHHGATWFQGKVPANGSTAYLYLGKLGEGGSSTLRFVVRYEGKKLADLGKCTVMVDGVEIASFAPALNRADQPSDGSVRQLADIHFDDVRPMVLAMINGQSAVIRTADGKEIRLDRAALDEMRSVLSAYLHLQGGAP